MKKQACCLALLLFLFLNHTALQAQEPEIQSPAAIVEKSKNQKALSKIGFDYGVGITKINLNNLNERLKELKIGTVNDLLATFSVSLYGGLNGFAGITMESCIGIAEGYELFRQNTYLKLITFSFGPSLFLPVYRTKRVFFWAVGGLRFTNMSLDYNAASNSAANFNNLLTSPSGNGSGLSISSTSNSNALFGGRFQFRLEKGYQEESADFRLGLDAGYAHCFKFYPWHETGSWVPIANMPVVKPDNFYFNINFSGYF